MNGKTNIFLVGPMGAGKTTVGKRLADFRNLSFVDSDHEIEARTGVDISLIFEKEGEAGFRKREQQVIQELTQRHQIVLATGGGAVLESDTRKCLSARGFVVYLHATVEQQLFRTARTENRPLLQNVADRRQVLEDLLAARDPLYREVADLIVETDGRNARQLAREIEDHLDRPATAL